jgi:hypothetical protein
MLMGPLPLAMLTHRSAGDDGVRLIRFLKTRERSSTAEAA